MLNNQPFKIFLRLAFNSTELKRNLNMLETAFEGPQATFSTYCDMFG
jgi:hypothetical protein